MSPHKVPTHLQQSDGLWKFSFRQIILAAAAVLLVIPQFVAWTPSIGPSVSDLMRMGYPGLGFLFPAGSLPLLPVLVAAATLAIFVAAALPLDPPLEHGVLIAVQWLIRHGYQEPEQAAVALGEIIVKGNRVESDYGIHAVWEMPSANLRLADAVEVELFEDHWGEFLSGLTASVMTLTRAVRIDPESVAGAIDRYRGAAADSAHAVATWLRENARDQHLIERRHFLAICASEEQEFLDSEQEVQDSISDLRFRSDLIRRLEGDELREVVQSTFTTRAPARKRLGPTDRPFNASNAWFADGEWHIVMAFGRWPRILRDNALAPLIDGVYEVDVAEHIKPVEADDILDGLERRSDAMKASPGEYRKRKLAIDDLDSFVLALEGGEESPFDVAIYLHVHGPIKKVVHQNAKRIIKRARRAGARVNTLPWEQPSAMLCVAPLAVNALPRRTKRVDTSSVKRLYPWSASSMSIDGGVPWGETLDSNRPVLWTPWRRPMIANPHYVCYMMSGGGKGFGWKVWSSRALFSGVTHEFFGFDQAEEDLAVGEYGKWAEYCGIEYRHVAAVDDFEPALADLDNYRWLGPGITWNIARLPIIDRPQFLAMVKEKLWKRASEHRARRQWAIDELWSFVKISQDLGADPYWLARCIASIEDLIRTGRHVQVGAALFTQRAKDSIEVPLMAIIQSQASTQQFGMHQPAEITDVADRLHWTPADIATIKKFSPGQSILAAGPWRVAMRVTASDEEFEMANTDGVARIDTLPAREVEDDTGAA